MKAADRVLPHDSFLTELVPPLPHSMSGRHDGSGPEGKALAGGANAR